MTLMQIERRIEGLNCSETVKDSTVRNVTSHFNMFALLAALASASGFQYDKWTQSVLCLAKEGQGTVCDTINAYIEAWEKAKDTNLAALKAAYGDKWEEMKMYFDPTEIYGDVIIATADNLTDALEEITSGYSLAVIA